MKSVKQWGQWLAVAFMVVLLLCGCAPVSGAEAAKGSVVQSSVEQSSVEQSSVTQSSPVQSGEVRSSDETLVSESQDAQPQDTQQEELTVEEDGEYSTKEEVALYLHIYAKLPSNYITKNEAEKLGWNSKKGNLWDVAPGKSIGGSHYGNYEKLLPDNKGRKYFECDIDYDGKYRGAERIIYSNDGLIYYTGDHYKTFDLLYE